MTYLWAGPETHVAFVHYVSGPIPHLCHYLLFLSQCKGAYVTSVHCAIANPFIYAIIFYFFPGARGGIFIVLQVFEKIFFYKMKKHVSWLLMIIIKKYNKL